jgi:hypothetical protein
MDGTGHIEEKYREVSKITPMHTWKARAAQVVEDLT